MPSLTKTMLEREQETGGKVRVIWDSEIKGFGARLQPSSIAFVFEYRGNRRIRRRMTIARLGETFPALAGIEVLWIAVDNDPSGAGGKAAHRCADRWTAAGCEVGLVKANAVKADINDVAREYRDAW